MKKQLRSFVGMVNCHQDVWQGGSDILAPLSELTSETAPWQWTSLEQEAFEKMKQVSSEETLLAYPNFNDIFEIHTDASDHQLGAVMSQKG